MIKIIVIASGIVAGSLVVLARELCKFSEEVNPYRNYRTEWTEDTNTCEEWEG